METSLETLISQVINRHSEVCQRFPFLNSINNRLMLARERCERCEIMLPFVGEFNAGKTSLVNRLLGGNLLPTDVLPTTSLICEIRFSAEKDMAEISSDDGSIERLNDLNALQGKELSRSNLLKISSSSTLIPQGILIVDTPGLSSDIARHERTIFDYVPRADALLLTIDANQGFTKTTRDFLEIVNPLNKKVYIVLAKSDTKSPEDMIHLKEHLENNHDVIRPQKVIATSARNGKIEDLVSALSEIYKIRKDILHETISKEVSNTAAESINLLDLQISSSNLDTKEIDKDIERLKAEMDVSREKMETEIDNTIRKFSDLEQKTVDAFEGYMAKDTDHLVDVAFNKRDELETTFDNSIKRASEYAINGVYKKEAEGILKGLASAVKDITRRVDVGSFGILMTNLITDATVVALLNFIVPGGFIEAILATIVMRFAGRWPTMQKMFVHILDPIRKLIASVVKIVARSFVEKGIKDAIQRASETLSHEINNMTEEIVHEIEGKITARFSEGENQIITALDTLKSEKKKKESEFFDYIQGVKDARSSIKDIIAILERREGDGNPQGDRKRGTS